VGIVHREVAPRRVLVRPDGTVALSVYGLTYQYEVARPGSVSQIHGVRYTSPEQIMGQSPGVASDVYALGVIAYQCLTGRTPFEGERLIDVALRTVREEPPPLPTEVPASVRSIVDQAIAKKPEDRWPTAAALAAAARAWMGTIQ
jgi:serine/threonine-protein kinase